MKKIVFLLSVSILLTCRAFACTNLLVGRLASTDGSVFISYSADSYGMYGRLKHWPSGRHAAGEMIEIRDGDTNKYLSHIPQASETYNVVGQINEFQVSIMETTFGGRPELTDPKGGIDYVSLMRLGLQRAKTARQAIKVMTDLVAEYGYASEGESFSIADKNEIWIMEMIGKGPDCKGAVWVAVRIPDDCIAAHANQSRIHQFDRKDTKNVLYSKDVISFAREKGYFRGNDADFSFSAAYAPADFGTQRYCDARVWSFFNRYVEDMERYIDFVDGRHIGQSEVMPLYFKPKQKLSRQNVFSAMRDHYEGTPFDITKDAGSGIYGAPYRPTPLSWEYKGKQYFNERPISTQQAAYTVVAQLRSWLPDALGGILWWGNDDPNMVAYTPVYCCTRQVPLCYDTPDANDVTFSWDSAFWLCNWVANMVYPRYSMLFPALAASRDEIEQIQDKELPDFESKVLAIIKNEHDVEKAQTFLEKQTNIYAEKMMRQWKKLGEYLIVKFNDQTIKVENSDGSYKLTSDGLAVPPVRPGFPDAFKETIVRETGERYRIPDKETCD